MNTGYAYPQMGYNPGPSIISWQPVHPGVQTPMMPMASSSMSNQSIHGMGGQPAQQQSTGGVQTSDSMNGLEARQG